VEGKFIEFIKFEVEVLRKVVRLIIQITVSFITKMLYHTYEPQFATFELLTNLFKKLSLLLALNTYFSSNKLRLPALII